MYVKAQVRMKSSGRLVDEVWVDTLNPPRPREILYVVSGEVMMPCVVVDNAASNVLHVNSAYYNPHWHAVQALSSEK